MASTTVNQNITLKGLDNINETIEIKPIDITNKNELTVTKPIDLNFTSDAKSDMKSDNKSDAKSKLDLAIEPLKIESDQRSAVDVKPLVIDSCQTSVTKLAPLPPTCIDQPYNHHFGITFLGMELWGFSVNGRSGMVIDNPSRRHALVTIPAPPKGHCQDVDPRQEPPHRGLKVRVGGQDDSRR